MDTQQGVVVITGGGSGMGQLLAQNHAREGWKVAILDVDEKGMEETADGLPSVFRFVADVTSVEQVNNAIAHICAEHGSIEKFYNCAAIMPFGAIAEQDIAVMNRIIDIDVKGFIIASKAVLPVMLEQGRGQFVGFASSAGLMPTLNTGVYSAAKAAVAFFMEVMYHENMNKGIDFVCVCPPAVNTPLLEQGKATHWTKSLEMSEPLEPQEVLDEIERCLSSKKFWCFPGKQTRFGITFRRWFPGLFWKQIHKIEGE